MPYVDLQFVLPKTVGLPMWWWFGWLGIGSVSIYLLFSWWYTREAVREDEIAMKEEAEKHEGASGSHGSSGTA
ncbi:MAG: hypothetical protein P8Y02_02050 [Deinococcales bacterium]|jgi:hypothetical protein